MTDLAPWEQRFRGLRWNQMPGSDPTEQRLNFALFRRGKAKIDELRAESREVVSAPKAVPLKRTDKMGDDEKRHLAAVVKDLKAEIAKSGMPEKRALRAFNLSEGSLTPFELRRFSTGRLQRLCDMLAELQETNKQKEEA